jgi:hypothetical protein
MSDLAFRLWRLLPERLRVPLDILRRRPHWQGAGAIFIHVPKAAGVSVSRVLYGRPLGHFRAVDIRRVCPETFAGLPTFGVVRHPVDRLLSAYRFARSGGTGVMGMRQPRFYQAECFRSFDTFVRDWLVAQDPDRLDGVFLPQHHYLCEGDRVIVDQVIKLERIEQGMRELSAMLGRELKIGHHNRSRAAAPAVVHPETLDMIVALYRQDFEIFDYPTEMSR